MQALILLALATLFTNAWAGGYAGALERPWLFYAYQIDGLLPSSAQKLGFKCVKGDVTTANPNPQAWDDISKTCQGKWQSCGEAKKVARCNYNQLMAFVGKVQSGAKLVPGDDQNLKTPPPKDTAVKFYEYSAAQPQKPGKNGKPPKVVKDYPAHNFLRTTNQDEYVDFVRQTSDVVKSAKSQRPGNEALFDGFKSATEQIIEARQGDHGVKHYDAVYKDLTPEGYVIEKKVVGPGQSPVGNPPTQWYDVDGPKTKQSTFDKGKLTKDAIEKRLLEYDSSYYADKVAEDHINVINAYRETLDKVNECLL